MSKKPDKCIYCGETPQKITRDHVPPKGVFTDPLPKNLITVPACKKCNEGAGEEDKQFKILLSLPLADVPAAKPLFKKAVTRLQKDPTLKAKLISNMEPVQLISSQGIMYEKGHLISMKPFAATIESVITRIIKGLYYHHFKKPLEANTEYSIDSLPNQTDKIIECLQMLNKKIIGDDHFSYCYAMETEGAERISLWVLVFYRKLWFYGSTFSKNIEETAELGGD